METTPPDPAYPSAAERAFEEFLDRRSRGDTVTFDQFCAKRPDLAAELRRRFGALAEALESAPADESAPPAPRPDRAGDPPSERLTKLRRRAGSDDRYQLEGEVARGGMGAILRVWDDDLRRHLAMKVMLGTGAEDAEAGDPASPSANENRLARFLEEAQVTGQLDHPGIVPVHELGVDTTGRVFFTMKLVKGSELKQVLDWVKERKDGWSETRALGILLRVCEAMAFAHSKGVIHRDLKPGNIMVGKFGETYVMDWGLAKVVGKKDTKDLRPRSEATTKSTVRSDRKDAADSDPDSPIVTMDGDVVGTPAYMSPEQANGATDLMGPATDVYAIGAILYHLIAGHMPYVRPGEKVSNYMILRWVREGPPTAVEKLNSAVPAELAAICEKAMARNIKHRYTDMTAMAEDLRAYLEGHVVTAYETGAVAEFRKWVKRNQGMAASIAAAVVLAVGGAGAVAVQQRWLAELAEEKRTVADAKTREANDARDRAELNSYIANVGAAEAALRMNDLTNFHKRLDECSEKLRNWEWNYLSAQSDNSLKILAGHENSLTTATFSPDGARVVTASLDNTARIWDAASGKEIATLLGHEQFVNSAAFSPDGTRVVTASWDGTARLWDAETGNELVVFRGHEESVNSAVFSPDGTCVVTASWDNTARLWDAASGREIALYKGHESGVAFAAFSPDGTRVVTASGDNTARLWDAVSGKELTVLRGHGFGVNSAVFSPDGERVVTASSDNTARLWDVASGKVYTVLRGHGAGVNVAAFSPDGKRVVTASGDSTARLWDGASGEELAILHGHSSVVNSAAFSFDSTRVVTASSDNTARLWDSVSGKEIAVLRGHGQLVYTAEFSADGKRIVTAAGDNRARLWDAECGNEIGVLRGHGQAVNSAVFNSDGTRVVTVSWDNTARLWDVTSNKVLTIYQRHGQGINSGAFSVDGTRVVTAAGDGSARIWDSTSGKDITALNGHKACVSAAAFGFDGAQVVTASGDGTARLWDADSGKEILVLRGHEKSVNSAVLSRDGTHILTASWDNTARLWDVTSGIAITVFRGHGSGVQSAAFSPDGALVVTASWDNTARIWNSVSGEEIAVLRGHGSAVKSAAFSPDGTRIVTASQDRTAHIWDSASGKEIAVLRGHVSAVNSAAFSPDGTRIVTASDDGTARIWDCIPYRERFPSIERHRDLTMRLDERIRTLHAVGVSVDVIEAELHADKSLTADDRTVAQFILFDLRKKQAEVEQKTKAETQRAESDGKLAYDVLKYPGASMTNVRAALALASRALGLVPGQADYIRSVGLAYYRLSQFREALEVLLRAEARHRAARDDRPADWSFLAMTYSKLNRLDDARAALVRAQELAAAERFKDNPDVATILAEAQAVVAAAEPKK